MRALIIARKTLLELLREPKVLGAVLGLPVAFLGIFAASGGSPILRTHAVLVEPADSAKEPLVGAVEGLRYPDGRPVFETTSSPGRPDADEALADKSATALMEVTRADGKPTVVLRGDALSLQFLTAATILNAAVREQEERASGYPSVIRVEERPLAAQGPRTDFDLYAPGVIVFGIMLLVPQTAMLIGREVRWRTLQRLRLTRMGTFDLFTGVTLAQLVVAVAQMALVLAVAPLFGFHNNGSTVLAFLAGLALSFSAIGVGLLVACFIRNDSQASNVGGGVGMVQVFLSGSLFPVPMPALLSVSGHEMGLFDVFPATHGFLALQQVLCDNASFEQVGFRLLMTLALSVLTMAVGVIVFKRLWIRDR